MTLLKKSFLLIRLWNQLHSNWMSAISPPSPSVSPTTPPSLRLDVELAAQQRKVILRQTTLSACEPSLPCVLSFVVVVVFFKAFMGVSTTEELQHAIVACKDLINTTPNDSAEKKKLVGKLVQLRLKLQETQVWLDNDPIYLRHSLQSINYGPVSQLIGYRNAVQEVTGLNLSLANICSLEVTLLQSGERKYN